MRRGWLIAALACLFPAVAMAGEKEELADQAWTVLDKATRSGDMLARARALTILPQVPGKNIEPYLREGLKDPQWIVRKAAIRVMWAKGDADARAVGLASLRDSSLPIEDDAFDLVAGLKPAEARAMILSAILDPATPTRDKLMTAVQNQDHATQVAVFAAGLSKADPFFQAKLLEVRREEKPPLAEALLKEKDPKTLAGVLRFVADAGVPIAAAVLKPLLKSSDPEVRYGAADLLAKAGDSAAVLVLLPLLDGKHDDQLRFLKAAAAAPSEALVAKLKKFLDPNTPVDLLVYVYEAFAGSQDEEVRKRVESDLDSTVMPRRAAAARSIGRLLGTRALPKLNQLLVDGNPLIRQLAAEALGDLSQAESVEVLERSLRDTERDVRLSVIKALAKIHDKSVVGVASFVIYDTDPEIKKTAILAVCNVNHESSLPILRINIEDGDAEVRFNVIRAMIYLDPAMALSYFERALGGLRGDDIVSLAETFKAGFLPFLKKAVDSDRAWARQGALRGIRMLPGAEVAFLKEIAATNAYGDARKGALQRLEELGCADVLEVAGALLKDKDPDVRIAGVGVFSRCGDNSTLDAVKAVVLEDHEENVRVAAAAALLGYPKTGKRGAPKAPDKGKKK